ncbi:DNA polymerase III subunit delta' [Zavarzinia aquatilis]|uniref:DNA polymerase III subunit delta n=1 Tax=Zavarzinia aquatilis TaxID=2211142 RepID=A0A317EHY8_9PROT|nr:DNA polymerase III subunit delta' [Zavarzinia aquatilis]PWR25906.1 DNA polymerase III subunit delta' [Zavarzinia aquatilis]
MAKAEAPPASQIPLPRANPDLIGHEEAERVLLDAVQGGKLHHAWLITGPRGIGKATLGYRFARFLFAHGLDAPVDMFGGPPQPLQQSPDDPLFRRIAAGSHPDLVTLEREENPRTKALRDEIVVDQVRDLAGFFAMTPAEGGFRVAIIDAIDEMNRNAANALLKLLEEPPPRSLLILIAHAPGRLLPTIRSRCRRLALRPLPEAEVGTIVNRLAPGLPADEVRGLCRLADGSPGRALALQAAGGLKHYRALGDLLAPLARRQGLDIKAVNALADRFAGREGGDLFRLTFELLGLWLVRMIRLAATGSIDEAMVGEGAAMRALGAAARLERWSEVWEKINALAARAEAVNLDRRQVLVAALGLIERCARQSVS